MPAHRFITLTDWTVYAMLLLSREESILHEGLPARIWRCQTWGYWRGCSILFRYTYGHWHWVMRQVTTAGQLLSNGYSKSIHIQGKGHKKITPSHTPFRPPNPHDCIRILCMVYHQPPVQVRYTWLCIRHVQIVIFTIYVVPSASELGKYMLCNRWCYNLPPVPPRSPIWFRLNNRRTFVSLKWIWMDKTLPKMNS